MIIGCTVNILAQIICYYIYIDDSQSKGNWPQPCHKGTGCDVLIVIFPPGN